MQKIALTCDVCGAPLTMQSGGDTAVCEYCGMKYALARLREKARSIRGTVTVDGVVKTTSADFEIHAGILTKYHGADTRIVIPNGVKAIADGCFRGQERYITSVILPEGLQTISSGTFRDFQITEIHLPDSLTQLASGAFFQCHRLRKINIPTGIKQIENGVFQNCTALEQVALSRGLKVIGVNAFNNCKALRAVSLPDSISRIEEHAFGGCSSLEQINIPDSVTELGEGAFSNCPKLKNVIMSESAFRRLCPKEIHEYKPSHFDIASRSVVYGHSVYYWFWSAFSHSVSYPASAVLPYGIPFSKEVSPWVRDVGMQKYTLIQEKGRENLRKCKRCQYCGGTFRGIFSKTCSQCGKLKDY